MAPDRAGTGAGKESAAELSELSHRTTPDTVGRHPDRGIHGADNAPQRSLTDKSGTKPIHINEETKALKTKHSSNRANNLRGQRALLCVQASQHRPQLFLVFAAISTSSMSLLKHTSDESRNSADYTHDTHIIKAFSIETAIVSHVSVRGGIR